MGKHGYIWLVLLSLTMRGAAWAQPEPFALRNYKAVDGLPQSQVRVMLEDRNGYLWIGTEGGGLARFDGRSFKVYTTLDGLQSNIVWYLKLDSKQNLWVIHPRGITRFDGKSFKRFEQPVEPAQARRLRRMFEMQDTIFFTTTPGYLGKIYRDSVYYWSQPVRAGDKRLISFVHRTPQQGVMMVLNDSSLLLRTAERDKAMSYKGVFNRLDNAFNLGDEVWLHTDGGYYTVDFAAGTFHHRELPIRHHILLYDPLNDVFWTRDGHYLLKEKRQGETTHIDTVMYDAEISQVLVDQEGNTWLGTNGSGLYKYYLRDFERVSPPDLHNVMAVRVDRRGNTWMASTTQGLIRVTPQGKTVVYPIDDRQSSMSHVYAIGEAPDGTIWVGAWRGLGRYLPAEDKFQWYTRDDGLSSSAIVSIQFDERGHLWIGTFGGGVNDYDGKTFVHYTTAQGLRTNAIAALYYHTPDRTLYVGDEFGLSTITDGQVSRLTIPGMDNTAVMSMQSFQDSLVAIGTGGAGVVMYHPRRRTATHITTHHGLTSDFIYFVAADREDHLWVGSEKGITRLRVDARGEVIENLHYDYDNGLAGIETNQNAFYIDQQHHYFGLIDGVYQYHQTDTRHRHAFDLHLTGVDIVYGAFPAADYADSTMGFFKIPHHLRLPPDKNHITFRFNRVDKRYPKAVKFRYQLDNFDHTWSQPSSATEVTYSNLPPGDYVFRVKCTNDSGSWSDQEIAYAFTIRAPFYQTASFLVVAFILLGGLITLVLYLRVKQRVNHVMMLERIRTQEQETLRREIARDFHDEMGNQLTRIINYISLLKLNAQEQEGREDTRNQSLYTKVEDAAKYLYTGTRDFIWSIDPGNDELSKLFIHIRDFGEKLFEEKGVSFRAFNEVRDKVKLPYGFSREANLIFKEAMTNAFKYAEARNVTLYLKRLDDGQFEMGFRDDGVGFYTDDIKKTNGLKNIQERADRLQATLRIHSARGEGTQIILQFKLNKTLKYGFTF